MLLVDALPSTVEAGGVSLPVCCGFRRNVAAELVDRDAPGAASSLLWCLMATRGPDGRRSLPEEVAADPAPWLAAALEWHDAAMGAMPYGDPLAPDARAADGPRTFDWEADAALVTADFQRLYGLDLARHARMKEGAIVCHPGPMNRGMEIMPEVADAPNSKILNQVNAGVCTRMAAMYLLLGGDDNDVA